MRKERKTGVSYSSAAHALVLIIMLIGLPSFLMTRPPPEPMAITVDIVPIGAIVNIKPAEAPPKPKEEDKKQESKKPTPPVKTPEPPKPDPKPEPVPTDKPKEAEKKKEEKKPEEKKEKPKMDDLAKILAGVKAEAEKKQADKPDKKITDSSSKATAITNVPYDPSLPVSQTDKDVIRSQIYKCWRIGAMAGSKEAEKLIFDVEITLNRDGTLASEPKPAKETLARMSNPTYRAAVENAMLAVRMCTPLQTLPGGKYESWSFISFTFDPSKALY